MQTSGQGILGTYVVISGSLEAHSLKIYEVRLLHRKGKLIHVYKRYILLRGDQRNLIQEHEFADTALKTMGLLTKCQYCRIVATSSMGKDSLLLLRSVTNGRYER